MELHHLGGFRVFLGEAGQSLIEGQDVVGWHIGWHILRIEFDSVQTAAVFDAVLAAGALDEDATHRLGCGCEEMAAAFKLLVADKPQIGFVNEGGGLKSLAGFLLGNPLRRQNAEFSVNERQQFRGGLSVSSPRSMKQFRHWQHAGSIAR